jgi:hypothetical protein
MPKRFWPTQRIPDVLPMADELRERLNDLRPKIEEKIDALAW